MSVGQGTYDEGGPKTLVRFHTEHIQLSEIYFDWGRFWSLDIDVPLIIIDAIHGRDCLLDPSKIWEGRDRRLGPASFLKIRHPM
jgi:hypothetical protein